MIIGNIYKVNLIYKIDKSLKINDFQIKYFKNKSI